MRDRADRPRADRLRPDRLRARLLASPGVRTVRRPADGGSPAFDLAYARTGGDRGGTTMVVIPGGPGLGSVRTYAGLRRRATQAGIDLVMVEHRGVGLSRTDLDGHDLPAAAVTISRAVDDVVAVLDAEGIDRAAVYGSSYGSYLAQGVAAQHPSRVAGVVLDSAMLSAQDHLVVRDHARAVLWDGRHPDTRSLAAELRALVADGLVTVAELSAARVVHEFCGPSVLHRLLDQLRAGRGARTWRRVVALEAADTGRTIPFLMEFDLVGVIAFRELNFAPAPDGLPFDPAAAFTALAARYPAFEAEPFDLVGALSRSAWPVVVLAGERDLRTPLPIAEQIVDRAPQGGLILLPDSGHSVLDTRPEAFLEVARTVGTSGVAGLPDRAPAIAAAAARPPLVSLATLVGVSLAVERRLPPRRRPPRT